MPDFAYIQRNSTDNSKINVDITQTVFMTSEKTHRLMRHLRIMKKSWFNRNKVRNHSEFSTKGKINPGTGVSASNRHIP